MNGLFLGVDGGQSSTTAVIGEESGKIIGWSSAGPCNHVSGPHAREKFLRVVGLCISQALEQAGVKPGPAPWKFRAACLGMSGGPNDKAALIHELVEADHVLVTHDAMTALAGAIPDEPGIVVIAGTGSIAFGRNAAGATARAGGWGYIFGDEGGSFDIARQAIRAILREHEGWGGRTALTPALLEATGTRDANEMLHLLYTSEWPRSRVASLAKTVDAVAAEGDPTAIGVLHQAAQQLALLSGNVRQQLCGESEAPRVSWTGGAFNSAILLERFRLLVSLQAETICEPPKHGPAVGALLLAWRAAGCAAVPLAD